MNGLSMLNAGSECDAPKCAESYHDTLVGNLTRKKNRAQAELQAATDALEALEKNPEVTKVLELLSKAGR